MDPHPYYRRSLPKPLNFTLFKFDRIDLTFARLPPYPQPDPSGVLPDSRPLANSLFDGRAAAAVRSSVGDPMSAWLAFLEYKDYSGAAPAISILTPNCLAAMAYTDYFPDDLRAKSLRSKVSDVIMQASPGWCGTFGPDVNSLGQSSFEGNYDMAEMFILPLVYSYYDELTPNARERLITLLLQGGRIHRASIEGGEDAFTSGGAPNDWSRAGYVSVGVNLRDIPETENHVLMIATARYLTNQLLYQRDHDPGHHDNRRNGDPGDSRPNCTDQVLGLLRNELRDDFAEYNAKNYQEETC